MTMSLLKATPPRVPEYATAQCEARGSISCTNGVIVGALVGADVGKLVGNAVGNAVKFVSYSLGHGHELLVIALRDFRA
jgi:hypothetical protein